jgi:hypothetical protein
MANSFTAGSFFGFTWFYRAVPTRQIASRYALAHLSHALEAALHWLTVDTPFGLTCLDLI